MARGNCSIIYRNKNVPLYIQWYSSFHLGCVSGILLQISVITSPLILSLDSHVERTWKEVPRLDPVVYTFPLVIGKSVTMPCRWDWCRWSLQRVMFITDLCYNFLKYYHNTACAIDLRLTGSVLHSAFFYESLFLQVILVQVDIIGAVPLVTLCLFYGRY